MKPRFSTSLDLNHSHICSFLRQNGVEVSDFAGVGVVPDALVYFKGTARWCEIKVPTRRASFPFKQLEYISQTKMDVAFITNVSDALVYAAAGIGALTQRQKDAIAGLLVRNPGKKAFTVSQVESALGDK